MDETHSQEGNPGIIPCGQPNERLRLTISPVPPTPPPKIHVVIHGIDLNGDGEYDFENGPSSLNADLPLEATIPAGCGKMKLEGRPRRAKKVEWDITPVPHSPDADGGSQTTGTVSIKARGNRLFIEINVEGAAPNLPHAQHLHGSLVAGVENSCPTASARNLITNDDLISVAEGTPSYGGKGSASKGGVARPPTKCFLCLFQYSS
jgi:hypothetical protein